MRISDWSSDVCSSDLVFVRDRRGFDRSPNPDEFTFPEMICDVGLAHLGWIEVDRMKHCQGQHRLGDALIFRFIVVHVELPIGFRRVRTTVLTIVPTEANDPGSRSRTRAR